MTIRPGTSIHIVDQDSNMKSMVYDVIDRRIIIAQTSPPLTRRSINGEISISFVTKRSGQPIRYALRAVVTDFIAKYELASTTVLAVGLEQKTPLEVDTLRMDYRVRPPADSNISVAWKGQNLNIIDVSLGGLQFDYRGNDLPKMGEALKIILKIDDNSLELTANVIKITAPVSDELCIRYIGVKFVGSRRDYERYLTQKILEIQRGLLVDGKLV